MPNAACPATRPEPSPPRAVATPLGVRWPGRGDANLTRRPSGRAGGCGAFSDTKLDITVLDADFRTQKLPTNLAHLSVKGARPLAIAQVVSVHGVMAQGFVAASPVGSGIGDADTGIVGVCLCWWNAEGCQCYGCWRRHAHYCPLHQFFLFCPPNGRVVVATDKVSHFGDVRRR